MAPQSGLVLVLMAYFELTLDGEWGEETITWHGEFPFDFNLFLEDQLFSSMVDRHIRISMDQLKREVVEIMMAYRAGRI